jgi:hypothetical protein
LNREQFFRQFVGNASVRDEHLFDPAKRDDDSERKGLRSIVPLLYRSPGYLKIDTTHSDFQYSEGLEQFRAEAQHTCKIVPLPQGAQQVLPSRFGQT